MAKLGIEQTVRDQYTLLTAELPDQGVRERKVLCGGHSLGGVITGYFAVADFDGNPATTADAGHRQCAGYFALDTTVSTSLADLSGSIPDDTNLPDIGLGYGVVQAGLDSGLLPRSLSAPVLLNAETMTLLAIAGVGAIQDPGGEADLPSYLPANLNIEATNRFLFAKDAAAFLTGSPAVKDFRLTNETVLGALLDDNSVPLAFLQSSVGFFDGGPIVDKSFPVANGGEEQPGLFGTAYKAIPDRPHGPLYTWRNYDRVGDRDDPGYRSADGTPFTGAGKEVTDIQELARSLAEQPLDFTEQYFPTKLITDIELSTSPQVKRLVVHPEGLDGQPDAHRPRGRRTAGGPRPRRPRSRGRRRLPAPRRADRGAHAEQRPPGTRLHEPQRSSPGIPSSFLPWKKGPGGSSSRALSPYGCRLSRLRPCPPRSRPPRRRSRCSRGGPARRPRRSHRWGRPWRRSRWCGSGRCR